MLTKKEKLEKKKKETILRRRELNKRPMGRPKSYTREIGQHIYNELIKGRSLKKICTKDNNMPSEPTVYSWLQREKKSFVEDFFNKYKEAKNIQAERFVEEIIDIADDGENDTYERLNPRTGKIETVVDQDVIRRSELRLKARMWVTSRLLPKKYGDQSKVELTGVDGSPLIPEKILIDFGNKEVVELEDE